MAPTDPVTDEPAACPYLGLPDDPRAHFTIATPAHRCHVKRKPSPIDLGHQGVYCLTSDFPACNRFRAPAVATAVPEVPLPVAPAPAPVARATAVPRRKRARSTVATPVADTRARLPQTAPLAADQIRSRSGGKRNVGRRALLLLILLALAALAAAVATGSLARLLPADLLPGSVALPSATAAETPPLGSASPVASAAPTAVASPSLSVSPTLVPSAPPASPVIHIVQRGETLTSIAAHYGVTLQALRRANHLEDVSLIRIGQKLIIPTAD